MKKIIFFSFMFFSIMSFAQAVIPESSKYGVIITTTNERIEYRNMKFSNGKVFYTNVNNNESEFLYDNSVKSITEGENTSESTSSKEVDKEKTDGGYEVATPSKLTSNKEIKNYLIKENNSQYMSGKSVNNIGSAFVVGGITCFVTGGLLNLASANKTYSYGEAPKGSPVPLIIGLFGVASGVALKIIGHSQMRNAINTYKNADARKFSPSFYALNNKDGVGLMMKF